MAPGAQSSSWLADRNVLPPAWATSGPGGQHPRGTCRADGEQHRPGAGQRRRVWRSLRAATGARRRWCVDSPSCHGGRSARKAWGGPGSSRCAAGRPGRAESQSVAVDLACSSSRWRDGSRGCSGRVPILSARRQCGEAQRGDQADVVTPPVHHAQVFLHQPSGLLEGCVLRRRPRWGEVRAVVGEPAGDGAGPRPAASVPAGPRTRRRGARRGAEDLLGGSRRAGARRARSQSASGIVQGPCGAGAAQAGAPARQPGGCGGVRHWQAMIPARPRRHRQPRGAVCRRSRPCPLVLRRRVRPAGRSCGARGARRVGPPARPRAPLGMTAVYLGATGSSSSSCTTPTGAAGARRPHHGPPGADPRLARRPRPGPRSPRC